MTPEERYERNHDRIEKRWQKLKKKAYRCPDCLNVKVGLNDSFMHKFHRFFIECENCHWCGESRPTIMLAIYAWNKEPRTNSDITITY